MRARRGRRVGERPVDQRPNSQRIGPAPNMSPIVGAGRAGRAAQRDARIEIGRGHADPRGGGGEPAFGGAHIGAAGKQSARRRRPGSGCSSRSVVARAPTVGGEVARRTAGQGGEAEQRRVALGAKRRHVGARWFAQRGDARDVEPGGAAGLEAAAAVSATIGRAARRCARRRPAARADGRRIGIGARGFRDDRDAHRIGIGRGGGDIAARRLDRAADAAEQIDLVGDVQPRIERPVLALGARCALAGGQRGRSRRRRRDSRLRQPLRAGFTQQRRGRGRDWRRRRGCRCSRRSASATSRSSTGS